jgi:hypothetical protein
MVRYLWAGMKSSSVGDVNLMSSPRQDKDHPRANRIRPLRQLLVYFDRETSYSGPVSNAFNEAARRLADAPRKRNEIVQELLSTIPSLLTSKTDRGGEASALQPSGESAGLRSGDEAEAPKPIRPLAGQKDFFG